MRSRPVEKNMMREALRRAGWKRLARNGDAEVWVEPNTGVLYTLSAAYRRLQRQPTA